MGSDENKITASCAHNSPQRWPPSPLIDQPKDDALVWRYMDLPKLIDILETHSLYLTRISLLNDPFEMSYPRANAVGGRENASSRLVDARKHFRDLYYVNCWHINEHESAAMWDLHAAKGAGLAVRTSFRALKQSVFVEEHSDRVYFAMIKYLDYEKDAFEGPIVDSDAFSPLMYKRKSFEHERELRIVTSNVLSAPVGVDPGTVPGIRLQVDLQKLLGRIAVAPSASTLFLNATQAVLQKFGFNESLLRKSDLEKSPLY